MSGNTEFTKVQNTIYDSKILSEALKGVLPSSFRVIEAVVEPLLQGFYPCYVRGTETATGGTQIRLNHGEVVLYTAIAAGNVDLTGDATAECLVVLSEDTDTPAADVTLRGAVVLADLNSGENNTGIVNAHRVDQAAASYLYVQVDAEDFTDGNVRVILIVA